MAYLALLWKARTIEKYRLRYEKEKINSINSETELRSTLYQKWTVYSNDSQRKLEQIYRNFCPEGLRVANSCTFVKENSSCLFRIMIAIVGGVLTYFLYTILVIQLSYWTFLGFAVVVAIILGVASSSTIRCLVLLLIPGLFSRVGRYTLACYALVLILTGPATNTLKNLDTLSASLACGQEQIKSSVEEIKESKDSPLNLMKETMSGTFEKIEYLAAKMKNLMTKIHRLTMSIAHVFQSTLSWLNSIEATCNSKLGTPYEHCANILVKGTNDCIKQFPESANLWNWDHLVQAACLNLKPAEPLCVVGDFAKGSIVATVKKKLITYSSRVQSLLATAVHVHRAHSCCNGSVPVSQATAGVITDLRNRADTLLAWLSWTCALTGLFLMLIIFRAKYYLHMFRTRSRFDNRYVTSELRELDLKRQRQGRETVLPLNTRERAKYVATSSIRLLPSERMYLTRSIVFMLITTLKLMIHMVADYSLYWVLTNVRLSSKQIDFQPSNRTEKIVVLGSGPLAATVRMVVEALSVPLILPAVSTVACLPDPNPPDLQRYAHIGALIFLLWLLAIFEPYGLRLRHVISGHYQPERAKARAVWLYYHIIRTRSCFLKYARRKLHRQYKYMSEEKFTFKNWLNNWIPCHWLRTLLGTGPTEPYCLLCCTKHRQDDLDRHLKRCETPSCPGVYCTRCFSDIGQLCTICYSPEDYGDLSDVSMEKYSTDDSDGWTDEYDDDGDDDMPLIGKPDREIDENEQQYNLKKKYSSKSILSTCSNDNQEESTPLKDCDYLNKDYTQQRVKVKKHINTLNPNKISEYFVTKNRAKIKASQIDVKDKTIMHTSYENIENKEKNLNYKVSPLNKGRGPMVFKDTDVTVNGITFPKGKLNAIIKIMMLLTAKDENIDNDKYKNGNKHKPFEYLVMEMFQPFETFIKKSLSRQIKCVNRRQQDNTTEVNESIQKEIRLLFDNKVFTKPTNSNTEGMPNPDLHSDFNFTNPEPILKYVDQGIKKVALTRVNKKLRPVRRSVKCFLDAKISVSKLLERSKCFKIDGDKFIWKKRRRRNKSLGFVSICSKMFGNKSIDHVINKSFRDALDKCVKENNAPVKITTSKEQRKQGFVNRLKFASKCKKINACSSKNNHHYLSTNPKDGTLEMQSGDESQDECSSKDSIDVNRITTQNDGYLKTSKQTEHQNAKNLGFWKNLRQRRRRTRSPYLFSISLKNEPSVSNFFSNYKRRKKTRQDQKDSSNLEVCKENEARYCRESRNLLDEQLCERMAKCDGILNMENNELMAEIDPKLSECLTNNDHNITKPKVRTINNSNKAKYKNTEVNANLAEEFSQGNRRIKYGNRSGEQIIFDDYKNSTAAMKGTLTNLTKKLKTVAFTFNKKRKNIPQSIMFSGGLILNLSNADSNQDDSNQDDSNQDVEDDIPFDYVVAHSEEWIDTSSEDCQTEHKIPDEDIENEESAACLQAKPIELCVHEWVVKPKEVVNDQTSTEDDDESDHEDEHGSFHVKLICNRNETSASRASLKHSKRTQSKNTYGNKDVQKRDIENQATIKLQDTTVQTETSEGAPIQHKTRIGKSYGQTDLPTARPFKGKIINTGDASLVYTDETPRRMKNTSNRSTTTLTKKVANVSTITSDWWSPMMERKSMRKKAERDIEINSHKTKHMGPAVTWETSLYREDDPSDTISASKYLLQSEQYYNQVVALHQLSATRGSHSQVKKYSVKEKPSFKMYRPLPNKGSKAKRLKECHSSHKNHLHGSVVPPTIKWRPVVTEQQAHALKYYKCRNPKNKKRNHKSEKVKEEKDSQNYEISQTNSNMWSSSIFSSS